MSRFPVFALTGCPDRCFRSTILLLACLLTLAVFCEAQNGSVPDPAGSGVYDTHEIDSVNLQDLSVIISVPVRSKSGAIPFGYSLEGSSDCRIVLSGINNSIHNVECGIGLNKSVAVGGATPYWNWNLTGVSLVIDEGALSSWGIGYTTSTRKLCSSNGDYYYSYSGLAVGDNNYQSYYLPSSTSYAFDKQGSSCNVGFSNVVTTNGGLTVSMSVAGSYPSVTIALPNGSTLVGSGPSDTITSISDSFGNSLSYSSSTNKFTDTLGTQPLTVTPSNWANGVGGAYAYTDTTGTTETISKVITTSQTIKTAFGCAYTTDLTQSGDLLTKVTYPDGNNIYFAYETISGGVTGRIQEITLRTGGTITYSYGAMTCLGGQFSPVTVMIPSSISRTTMDGTTTYTFNGVFTINGGYGWGTSTTVLDPGMNKTTYTFTGTDQFGSPVAPGASGCCALTLTQVQKWQNTGTVSSPVYTLISTDLFCYNGNTSNCATALTSYPITEKDVYHTIPGMSGSSRTQTQYDNSGNVTFVAEYDFGASNYTYQTTTSYGTWNGSACVPIGNYIYNRPCDVVTTDGTNTLSEARYTYGPHGTLLTKTVWTGFTWLPSSATIQLERYDCDFHGRERHTDDV